MNSNSGESEPEFMETLLFFQSVLEVEFFHTSLYNHKLSRLFWIRSLRNHPTVSQFSVDLLLLSLLFQAVYLRQINKKLQKLFSFHHEFKLVGISFNAGNLQRDGERFIELGFF